MACFAAGTIARVGCFQDSEGTWAQAGVGEDLAEVEWSEEVNKVVFF